MRFVVIVMALAMLSACASTLRTDFSYSPTDGKSLFIMEERSNFFSASSSVMFVEVDLENEVFLNDRVSVQQGMMSRLEPGTSSRLFSVDQFDGGQYALVSTYTVSGNTHTTRCFSLGTMVYDFPEAAVIILPLTPSEYVEGMARIMPEKVEARRQDLLDNVRSQLTSYPDIDASNLVIAEPVAAIKFEGKKQVFGSGCPVGKDLEITSIDEMLDQQTDPMSQLREMFQQRGLDLDQMLQDSRDRRNAADAGESED
tara:strand:+ start:9410 stop:10177 length:768 start_codon:yes stop_codon:yes gene_type:complete